jgi:tetratricopeptide (TPR) repeat protein
MTVSAPASLLFALTPTEETWTIIGPLAGHPARVVPNPLADARFRELVASLREWASQPVPLDRADPLGTEAFVQDRARRVSRRLTGALLVDEDRRAVAAALAGNGRVRLVLRVRPASEGTGPAADASLALPWELLAPEEPGLWPVQYGRLSVIREAVADGVPDLPEPAGPLTLATAIAAPEDRVVFAYEQEAFRLLAALSPLGQRAAFSDLGGLEDLVELVAAIRATAIHFRGYGLPGGLLFENALGFAEEVPVSELRRRLATILLSPRRAGSFPGLFFLSAPYSAREPQPGQGPAASALPADSSVAAALHRSGFAQVVGYFGPVSPDLTTRLEERFYETLAAGGSTLAAVELARSVLNEPLGAAGERVVHPFGWTQLAVYHRGPDRPLALPGRSRRLASRYRRRIVQVHGLPVLERGFIGRRDLLHEIRRRVHEGRRLLVLQGLGGLGKTALASHLLARIFEVKPADRLILRCQEAEGAADPVLVLRGQAEEHGRLHRFRFWDERMRDLRERFPDPVEGFVEVVRSLRRDRPHLAIYADNAESLQEGPKTEESRGLGTWRPGAEAWWRALEQLETEGEGLILLTTRYLWSDLGIDGLAGNLRKQGRYAEAERFLRQALQIDEETLGSDHPSYAASLAGLAAALEGQGRYLESEELLRRALPIFEKTLGPRHSSYGACLHNLADTLLRQGRLDEAEHLLRESLAIKVQVLGEGHPALSTTLHALAKVLEGQGRYRDSEEVLVRALTLVEKTLGPRHPSYGASLHNLTSVLQRQGRLTEAEAVLSEALALFDQTLGAEHPSHATAQHTLAGLYMLQILWQEAEELLWRSLGAIEKSLGAVHPNLAPTLTNLATVLARQGRAPESEPLLRRALEIVQNAYGPQSSDKAQVLVTLAQVQHLTGQACAVVTAREAREALFESLGAEHPVTRNALEILEGIGCEETGPTT